MHYFQLLAYLINPSPPSAEKIPSVVPAVFLSVQTEVPSRSAQPPGKESSWLLVSPCWLRRRAMSFCVSRAHREEAERGHQGSPTHVSIRGGQKGAKPSKKFPQAPWQSHAPLDAAHQCHPTCEWYYTAHLPFPGGALPPRGRTFLGSLTCCPLSCQAGSAQRCYCCPGLMEGEDMFSVCGRGRSELPLSSPW